MLPNLFSTRAILGLPYSSEQLKEALSIVEPPTEILLVGGAFSEAEAAEAGQVLAAYRKEIGASGSGFCMRVPPHFMEDNPREVGMKLVVEWVREQCAKQGIDDEHMPSDKPTSTILGKHKDIAHGFAKEMEDLCTLTGVYTADFAVSRVTKALQLLHPAPRVMMVGGGFVDDASKAEATFKEFWESQPSQPKTAFVSVDPQIWKEKGKEGVLEHLRAGVKHDLGL